MKLLILADIHANWAALQAVLNAEPHHDAVAFLGDAADYGPKPVECIRWLADHATYAVRGNHDNALGFDLDCRCMGSFRSYSVATRAWHRTLLAERDFEYLRNLPTLQWFQWDGWHIRLAHATPQGDLFEYLTKDRLEAHLQGLGDDIVLLGHTHVQDARTFGTVTVLNPGSVGLARDTPGSACYATFDGSKFVMKRIAYDVRETVEAIDDAPLSESVKQGLIARLLPLERRRTSETVTMQLGQPTTGR
ncbi:MAG TPA: metallophosphoesterase family protein [Pirellulales bacterium]|jgi:protein phosphatase|nr:metallophosphoesterase family protein [Pirellulales bacterium]